MEHLKAAEAASSNAGEDTLGGRIYHARDAVGLNMEEAARRLGVETETWKAWECDRDAPRANKLVTMAGLLGVSPSWLLAGTGTGPAPDHHDEGADLIRALEAASAEALASQQRVLDLVSRVRRADLA
ncbi:helix-turn-helix transcriptional regulator [Chelativorans sp. AA-79]|uniref:helix-turn-helix domain-containing protein n=1 Tax=Chelativorans sp. AA-79 TaxID=3028735 RepID=UPI0023F8D113|nr:helix-turn-helix transcriptional regulator [Chelativorans sp. AA-79]WEX07181.1 helix-turn-helix transcriptional regulator [Chelativorans sp. AA-79]